METLELGLGLAGDGNASYFGALDIFPQLYSSYGMKRLRRWHITDLIIARRDSDNDLEGFRAGADGWLDTAALMSWAGSASAYVDTLYDQEGNGHHAVQSSATAQFRIVNAGVLDVGPLGHPVMVPDGVNDFMTLTSALGFARNAAALTVAAVTGSAPSTGTQAIFAAPVNASVAGRSALYASGGSVVASGRSSDASSEQTASRVISGATRFIARQQYAAGVIDISANGVTTTGTIAPAQNTPDNDSGSAPRIAMSAGGAIPLAVPLSALILDRTARNVAQLDAALQKLLP